MEDKPLKNHSPAPIASDFGIVLQQSMAPISLAISEMAKADIVIKAGIFLLLPAAIVTALVVIVTGVPSMKLMNYYYSRSASATPQEPAMSLEERIAQGGPKTLIQSGEPREDKSAKIDGTEQSDDANQRAQNKRRLR